MSAAASERLASIISIGEVKHEIKTSALVKAIWAHHGGWREGHRHRSGNIILQKHLLHFQGPVMSRWDYYFYSSSDSSLKHTEPHNGAASYWLCLVYFQTSASLGCVTYLSAPAFFPKHISAELWVCIM